MTSLLRIARLLRGESLDAVAEKCGTFKSRLHSIEFWPKRPVSDKIKRALESHFGHPFSVLAYEVDGMRLAQSIAAAVESKLVKPTRGKKRA